MSNNVATLTQNQILRARILDLQNQISRAQIQQATGKKSDVYSGLRSDARTSISLNNTRDTIKTYQQNLAITKVRTDTMEAVFKRISDIAVEVRTSVLQVSGVAATATGSASSSLKSLAENRLKEIASLLNTEVDGRHLFSGLNLGATPMIDPGAVGSAGTPLDTVATGASALNNTAASGQARFNQIAGSTDTATAAAAIGATTINIAGPPPGVQAGTQLKFAGDPTVYTVTGTSAGQITIAGPGLTTAVTTGQSMNFLGIIDAQQPGLIYQGDTTPGAQVSARIDNGFDLEYGVRGDDQSLVTIMRSLYAVATSDLTTANEAGYRQMSSTVMSDLQNGFDQLQEQIGVLGVRQATMEQTDKRHGDFLTIVKTQITDVEDVDIADAITRLQLLQSNLEASFQMIASTKDMSLVNYL